MTAYDLHVPTMIAAVDAYRSAVVADAAARGAYLAAIAADDPPRWVACARAVLQTGRTLDGAALVLREMTEKSHRIYASDVEQALSIGSVIGEAGHIRAALYQAALAR